MPLFKSVKVEYWGIVRNAVPVSHEEVSLEGAVTVRELLRTLIQRHGERLRDVLYTVDMSLRDGVVILVNGSKIEALNGLETVLEEGAKAEIVVMTAVAGG